jgi:2-methylcitrate dehydratase PrpD
MTTPEVTRRLAAYLVNSKAESIPAPVTHEAVRTFLNWLGCALGGARHETMDVAISALQEFSGPPRASVLGRAERFDMLNAALLNGISSHVLDFDDTHLKTIIHPAGPVASCILALAETRPVTGREFLHALVLGVEAECRIGNAVYPNHYDVGWHITGTTGVFGAAAAAGKILGLSEQQMTWALGIAATQSSGLREMFGTMCKSFHPGAAARNGLLAAQLAAKNFTSSDRGIEAPRGFANVLSTKQDYREIVDGLGERFEILLNSYKPFACGIVIHPTIDGCVQLRNEHGLKPEDVEAVFVRAHPLVLELTGKRTPQTGLEGKFSVFHSAAVALIEGKAAEHEYTDPVVRDPVVIGLRDRVEVETSPEIREDEAYLEVRLRDGRVLQKHVPHAIGSLERPMSDQDLEAKFRALAENVLPPPRLDELIRLCWNIETAREVGAIARAAVA